MIRKVIESVQELDDLSEGSVVLCVGEPGEDVVAHQRATDTREWSSGARSYDVPSRNLFEMYGTIFLLWKPTQWPPSTQMQDLGSLTLGKLAEHDVPHHFRDAVESREQAEEVLLPVPTVHLDPEPEVATELGEAYTVGNVKKWVGSFKLHNVDIMLGDVGSPYHGLGLPRDSMVIQFWCEGESFDPWRYILSENELYYDTGTQRERAEADLPLLDASHYDKEVRVVIIG